MKSSQASRVLALPFAVLIAVIVSLGVQSLAAAKSSSEASASRKDADRDGLTDRSEMKRTRTNPRKADTDGDGLADGIEVNRTKTNPRKADTDGDGFSDGAEVTAGSSPRNPASVPTSPSTPVPPPSSPGSGPTTPTAETNASWTVPSTVHIGEPVTLDGSDSTGAAPLACTWSFENQDGSTVWQTRSGCETVFTFESPGVKYVELSVQGADDGTDSSKQTITVSSGSTPDTTAPDTSISSGPSATTASTAASFSFASTESGSSFECKLDSAAFGACANPKSYTGLALGSHTFSVRATDAAGNVDSTPATRSWTVEAASTQPDTTAPDTSISSGPTGSTTATSASFSFASTESGSSFECKLDSASFGACTSPKSYSSLATGGHTFSVRATDAAGNVDSTPATRSWTVSESAPPTAGSHCFASPHVCGYPDATNTGVPAGTTLTPSGSLNVSTAGATINALDVSGTINIVANNVTIQNTRVTLTGSGCGASNTCGNYEIRIDEGVTGTVIKNTELRTAAGTTCEHDIRNTSGPSLQITGVYMHGCDSNLYGGATMTDSYGVAKLAISNDHVENIYFNDTTFNSIHNTLINPVSQTAVIFGNSNGGTDTTNCKNQLTVTNSLLAGGGYTLYPCAHTSQPGTSSLNIQNNHFARCTTTEVYHPNGGEHSCSGGADSNGYYPFGGSFGMATNYYNGVGTWKGNVWDDNLAPVCISGSAGCS